MNKKPLYDEEELEILEALEAGVLKPVDGAEQHVLAHRAAATATFVKDQRLNIRKSINDKRVKRQWRSRSANLRPHSAS